MKPTVDGVLAASGTALAGALLFFGIAAGRAVRADAAGVDVEPALFTPASFAELAAKASDRPTVTAAEIGEAADLDPFRADRRRPARPYRIGGLSDDLVEATPDSMPVSAPTPPAFHLLGTLATPSGGLAVIEVPGVGTRVVAVGNSIGGFRLTSVSGGSATVSTGEFQHTLRVSRPTPEVGTPAAAAQQQPGNQVGPGGANAQQQPPQRPRGRNRAWGQDGGAQARERAREMARERWQRGGMRIRGRTDGQQPGGQP